VKTHQDDPLAAAIRQSLQASRADCPDAETIAAYAERALATAERRNVEVHLSNCSRCRETLLMMEKGTATILQEPKKGGSPLYRWPWLAAAAAAALVFVVWRALPPSVIQPEKPATQIVGDERALGKAQPPAEQSAQSAANKEPVEADQAKSKSLPAKPRSAAPSAGVAGAPPPPAREGAVEQERAAGARRDEQKLGEVAARRATAQEPVAAPQAPAAAAPPPAAKEESIATDRSAPFLMARQNQGDYRIAAGRKRASEVADAAPAITWRVWVSGLVERSADGGTTWTREPGVDAPGARAVIAPTADACWIVGDAGLILRFETGRGWTRVAPPAQIGFVAIEAPDAHNATITAADGRRFTTADGGQTWR
jgi:hypothetical protein